VAQGIPTLSMWIQLAVAALLLASGIVALRRGGVQTGPTRS
jgi:hypothetical protein